MQNPAAWQGEWRGRRNGGAAGGYRAVGIEGACGVEEFVAAAFGVEQFEAGVAQGEGDAREQVEVDADVGGEGQ
jgi:hypothetical protein